MFFIIISSGTVFVIFSRILTHSSILKQKLRNNHCTRKGSNAIDIHDSKDGVNIRNPECSSAGAICSLDLKGIRASAMLPAGPCECVK